MSENWSETEVLNIVESYFEMLNLELAGSRFNKSEHRRNLLPKLKSRTERSIESKHQNISAVLIKFGIPYINGYKPLSNYQALLVDVIQDYLIANPDFLKRLNNDIDETPLVPSVTDILSTLVAPPKREKTSKNDSVDDEKTPIYKPEINYLGKEEQNILVGAAGEEFVINYEKARLVLAGKDNFADNIEQVSKTIGPSAGYDILSYEIDGTDRFIEAKTTRYGKYTPFFFSKNELLFSEINNDKYFLYRVFELSKNPQLFYVNGSISEGFKTEPFVYIGRP